MARIRRRSDHPIPVRRALRLHACRGRCADRLLSRAAGRASAIGTRLHHSSTTAGPRPRSKTSACPVNASKPSCRRSSTRRSTRPTPMEDHGILIARHGKLVLEEYFHGETPRQAARQPLRRQERGLGSLRGGDARGPATQPVGPGLRRHERRQAAARPGTATESAHRRAPADDDVGTRLRRQRRGARPATRTGCGSRRIRISTAGRWISRW